MATERRLIDANALLKELDKFINPMPNANGLHFLNGLSTAITEIEDAPTVDAVEVVHGRWTHIVDDGEGGCYGFCSNCATEHHAQSASALKAFHRHCRWCGAKMDGDGNA